MKKVISFILTIAVILSGITFGLKETKAAGSVSIAVSSSQIISGNTLSVTVTLDNPSGITYASFSLCYDANMFQYAGGDATGSGYSGEIPFSVLGGTEEKNTYTYNLSFTATGTGTCNFKINGNQFVDTDVVDFSPTLGSASVTVMAVGSDDATLSSLAISSGSLNPAFAKWTLDYVCYVDNSVTAVNIGAAASQGGKVEVSGNYQSLAVGNNYITIKSYAPNGKVMTYNVNIVRSEPPTEPPTTEPPTETPEDVKVTIDKTNYEISSALTDDMIPEGFTWSKVEYDDNELFGATNEDLGLTLLYLVDKDENGSFYIYDKSTEEFYKYTVLTNGSNVYYVYDSRKAKEVPEGTEMDFTLHDTAIKAFRDSEDKDFYYFYAMNADGEYSWYAYDSKEDTIQRKSSASFAEEETTTEAETEPETTTVEEKTENGFDSKIIFIAVIVALLFVIVALLVVLAIKKKKDKDEPITEPLDEPEEIKITPEEEPKDTAQKVISDEDIKNFIDEANEINKDK